MELVDDLASLPTRRTKKKKTPRSDDSFAFSTIAPPPKTNGQEDDAHLRQLEYTRRTAPPDPAYNQHVLL
jgi:hypothetical protein